MTVFLVSVYPWLYTYIITISTFKILPLWLLCVVFPSLFNNYFFSCRVEARACHFLTYKALYAVVCRKTFLMLGILLLKGCLLMTDFIIIIIIINGMPCVPLMTQVLHFVSLIKKRQTGKYRRCELVTLTVDLETGAQCHTCCAVLS